MPGRLGSPGKLVFQEINFYIFVLNPEVLDRPSGSNGLFDGEGGGDQKVRSRDRTF
ncbi:hypothetical protein [Microcoleus sp. bin38.metabat.b11b12b14.051]|uniref:hypothetical protein n=1 Tax=Microcoleus sp. bin38.metabat.b11b12b14.051 TaxID=2742709 RepID=UPI0025E908CF|nr:hypothetical protein [Microcoleus sp. bin38.metabat.b11b12b14.051]